jgi:hypothetical protein
MAAGRRRVTIHTHLQQQYPRLAEGWTNRGQFGNPQWIATRLSARPLGEILRAELQDGAGWGLAELEGALDRLRARFAFADLLEQYRYLLSPDPDDFDAGNVEVLGLAALENVHLLRRASFPPIATGNALFDCSIVLASGQEVALDFKTASSSGYANLQAILRDVAVQWRRGLNLPRCEAQIHYAGTLTQEVVRLAEPGLRAAWGAALQAGPPALPTPWFQHLVDDLEINVRAVGPGLNVNRGFGGVRPEALQASRTVSRQATRKARHGMPFFLAYVARAGHPHGDLRLGVLHPAAIIAHRRESAAGGIAHERWLGLVSIDLTRHQPELSLLPRYAAQWPAGRTDADALLHQLERLHTRYRAR